MPKAPRKPNNSRKSTPRASRAPHIAVVGAGAFGGWTALYLLRQGAQVTLMDAWGPGNSRASSGGETRIIRGTYGPKSPYTDMTARALHLWKKHDKLWGRRLFQKTGVLWMAGENDAFEKASLPMLRKAGLDYEKLTRRELAKRYPQMNVDNVKWAIFEPDGGYLYARLACAAVLDAFLAEGGHYHELGVLTDGRGCDLAGGECRGIRLTDETELQADRYVFACGPWLPQLFPDVLTGKLIPHRQDVIFFGTPAGDARFTDQQMPVWMDYGQHNMYGIPGNAWRGFKVADDARGEAFEPTHGDRTVRVAAIEKARQHVAMRFPELANAPVTETRVCQYEDTPDRDFIIDKHPGAANLWMVGGGSGHGFKHGPALGEMVAGLVKKDQLAEATYRLARLG